LDLQAREVFKGLLEVKVFKAHPDLPGLRVSKGFKDLQALQVRKGFKGYKGYKVLLVHQLTLRVLLLQPVIYHQPVMSQATLML